ncbi:hypothetical protein CRG98_042185 [Punica granatum]|uniref:Retrotransposon gag domain-containing protein n=1 Tax=Punica granatum TaxID=22663 RepID=A0A2I0I098_PUNGR|nr:hypothetical protein CRG98_042185 [Punica granatum]
MATGTRAQEVSKLALALEEQDKAIFELKGNTSNTNTRIDQLAELISGLTLQQNRLMQQLQIGESNSTRHNPTGTDCGYYSAATRIGKLEFPRFGGDGVKDWLNRCEQFFEVDRTADELNLKLVVIHLEGKALQWHQAYMRAVAAESRVVK